MTTLLLANSKLYWGIIDRPPTGAGLQAARFAFESVLPISLDEAEIRFSVPWTGAEGRLVIVGCAIAQDTLSELLAASEDAGVRVEQVIPETWPSFITESLGSLPPEDVLATFEFRSGTFKSPRSRRHERIAWIAAATALVLTSASLSVGWHMQAAQFRTQTKAIEHQVADTVTRHLGLAEGATQSLDSALRLTAELRSLRQTRNQSATPLLSEDRLITFLGLLDHWPQDIPTRADSVQIDQDSLTLRGLVRSPQDYEALSGAMRGWLTSSGWTSPAGSSSRAGEAHAFTLASRQVAKPGHGGGS